MENQFLRELIQENFSNLSTFKAVDYFGLNLEVPNETKSIFLIPCGSLCLAASKEKVHWNSDGHYSYSWMETIILCEKFFETNLTDEQIKESLVEV